MTDTGYFLACAPPTATSVIVGGAWSVRIAPDPLGPVNKIVTLMRGGQRVRSALCPVPAGATVRLVRDEGSPRISVWSVTWEELGVLEGYREPGWRVEVNGRTVLTVADAEMRTPRPPVPRVPLWRRMVKALREQVRADADSIAKRLGYCRECECGGDW